MGGDGKKDAALSATQPLDNTQYTPNLFKPSMQYMPQEYFGNRPIEDPTSILNAYMMHMPEFLKASRSEVIPKNVVTPTQAAPQPLGSEATQGQGNNTAWARFIDEVNRRKQGVQ